MRRGEAGNELTVGAAEELVYGHSKASGHEVVEGYIDSGDGRSQDPASLEVLAAVYLLPKSADAPGVPADQELAIVLHRALYCQLPSDEPGLAPAVVSPVCFDLDDKKVPLFSTCYEGPDVGDLQRSSSIGRGRTTTRPYHGGVGPAAAPSPTGPAATTLTPCTSATVMAFGRRPCPCWTSRWPSPEISERGPSWSGCCRPESF